MKIIRSNNGSEFCSKDMTILFSSLGITHQTSCVYTPQHNGIVERQNRHLLEVSRILRFQASLPIKFWSDCILTATHLIYKMPSTVSGSVISNSFGKSLAAIAGNGRIIAIATEASVTEDISLLMILFSKYQVRCVPVRKVFATGARPSYTRGAKRAYLQPCRPN